MNENKYYYEFGEILLKLRIEYQNVQKLINELNGLVIVENNPERELELKLNKNSILNEPIDQELDLVVHKNKSFKRIRNLVIPFDYIKWMKSNAVFKLTKDDNYKFILDNKHDISNVYNPEIYIKNQEKFNDLSKEIDNSKLYNLPRISFSLNPYQYLSIDGEKLSLKDNRLNSKNRVDIIYDAKEDFININSTKKNRYMFIEELFGTKIPKDSLPHDYISVLGDNRDDNILMYDDYVKGSNKYLINEDNCLKLVYKK